MRVYWYNGAWNEITVGGFPGAKVECTNVLSGFGFATIPIPGYEGAALATWKARHYKKIRIKDDTETRTLWEGYINRVQPTRNGVTLFCLEPQAHLQRLIAGSWANYELDDGYVTGISGVGNVDMEDNTEVWTVNEHQNKGLLVVGMSPHFYEHHKDQAVVHLGYQGQPAGPQWHDKSFFELYSKVLGDAEIIYFHTTCNENDLAKLEVHYHLMITWAGTNPGAKFQIYNFTDVQWEDIIAAFVSGTPKKGTHTIAANITKYIDANGFVKLRRLTTGSGLDYTWKVWRTELSGTWSNAFVGTRIKILSNTSNKLTTDTDLNAHRVHVGDRYQIGELNSVILAAIFANETTLFASNEIEASDRHYTYRNFENTYCLEIAKAMLEFDNYEFWNDVATGFKFMCKKTFAASGLTIDESMIATDKFAGGYDADPVVKTAKVYGAPESGNVPLLGGYSSGSYVAGDPGRVFVNRHRYSQTELYQLVKAVVSGRDSVSFIGGLTLTADTAAIQSLTVGQTVNLGIDLDQDGSDEISEANILVRKITRTQPINGPLTTYIEVGKTPLTAQEPSGYTTDKPQWDRGLETRRDEQITAGLMGKMAGARVTAQAPYGAYGGRRTAPLDFEGDAKIQRAGTDRLLAKLTAMEFGTAGETVDLDAWGDLDLSGGSGDIDVSGNIDFDTQYKGLAYLGVKHLGLSSEAINMWKTTNVKSGKPLYLWKDDNLGHSYVMTDTNGNMKLARQNVQKMIAKLTQLEMGTVGNTEDLVGFNDLDLSGGSGDIDLDKLSIYNYSIEETTGEENLYIKAQVGASIWNTRDVWGNEDIQANVDVISDEDIYFGASGLHIFETAGSMVINTSLALIIEASGALGPQLIVQEDANNYWELLWSKLNDEAVYYAIDGGAHGDHYFHDNIYYDGVIDSFESLGREGDLALLRAIKHNKGSGTFDKNTLPSMIMNESQGIRVGGLQGFLVSLVKVNDTRIQELEAKINQLERDRN